MFLTILGIVLLVYLIIGAVVLGRLLYTNILCKEEIRKEPVVAIFVATIWPFIVMEELGYL